LTNRILSSTAIGLGLVLALAAGAGARSQAASQIRVTTTLTVAQEVPAPGGDVSEARGTFTATVTRSGAGATVAWRLVFHDLTGNASAAHIHVASAGQPGPVVVPLCGPCDDTATGTGTMDAAAVSALQAGRAYVNVHTSRNPAGEIRGQLAIVASVRAALVPGQERPRPTGALRKAHGLFTGTLTKSPSGTTSLQWKLTFSGLTGKALAAHIHTGVRGKAGPVVVPLCGPCVSGRNGKAKLSASVVKAFESGRAYVNVHTARNQAGEIRGQVPAAALTLTP
jgi:hypothetical protein